MSGTPKDPVIVDDSSDDDENVARKPAKRAKISDEDSPIKFTGTREFVLCLLVEPDQECREFLKDCKRNCDPEIHEECFQRDGTLHFTLFNKKSLTYQEAMAISSSYSTSLPVMNLTGFSSFPYCVALKTDTSIGDLVDSITPRIKFDPKKLHLSLHRIRGRHNWTRKDDYKKEFDRVRRMTNKNKFGTARGVRVILKEMHADYNGQDEGKFFRVLV